METTDDADAAQELARYEQQRQERKKRRNRVYGRVVFWVMVAALALLTYDSAAKAVDAYSIQHGSAQRGTFVATRCAPLCVGDVRPDAGAAPRVNVPLDTRQQVTVGRRLRVVLSGDRAVPLRTQEWAYPAVIGGLAVVALIGLGAYALRRRGR